MVLFAVSWPDAAVTIATIVAGVVTLYLQSRSNAAKQSAQLAENTKVSKAGAAASTIAASVVVDTAIRRHVEQGEGGEKLESLVESRQLLDQVKADGVTKPNGGAKP